MDQGKLFRQLLKSKELDMYLECMKEKDPSYAKKFREQVDAVLKALADVQKKTNGDVVDNLEKTGQFLKTVRGLFELEADKGAILNGITNCKAQYAGLAAYRARLNIGYIKESEEVIQEWVAKMKKKNKK